MTKPLFVVLRAVKWLLLAGLAVALVVLGCWFLLPDETLHPEAQALMEARPSVPPEQNGYFLLIGLSAAPDRDAHLSGRQIADAQLAAVRAKGFQATVDKAPFLGASPYPTRTPSGLICQARGETPHCLTALRAQRERLLAELAAKDVYLRRYQSLRRYAKFEAKATQPTTPSILDWPPVTELSELVDAAVAFAMETPSQQAAALHDLHDEVVLWRRIGRDADDMIMRVISATLLYKKYQLLSELLAQYPALLAQHSELIASMTVPLSAPDTDLRNALRGEFRYRSFPLQSLDKPDRPEIFSLDGQGPVMFDKLIGHRMYKPNATINLVFEQMQAAMDFYAQDAMQIQSGRAAFSKTGYQISYYDPRWWLYNPIGKILASVPPTRDSFASYSDQLHDLAGYSRLLELQRQINLNGIAPENTAAWIASVPAGLRNPYTDQAMTYDAVKRTLSFAPKSKKYTKENMPLTVNLGG